MPVAVWFIEGLMEIPVAYPSPQFVCHHVKSNQHNLDVITCPAKATQGHGKVGLHNAAETPSKTNE
jgi:hypothetical protein